MQFVPNARYFTARLALSCNALKNHSINHSIHLNGYKTEKPIAQKQPLGLCNKPYTLLRTAGCDNVRIFHPLCNQKNQTIEMIHGKTDSPLRHILSLTSPIANPTMLQQRIFSSLTHYFRNVNGFTSQHSFVLTSYRNRNSTLSLPQR